MSIENSSVLPIKDVLLESSDEYSVQESPPIPVQKPIENKVSIPESLDQNNLEKELEAIISYIRGQIKYLRDNNYPILDPDGYFIDSIKVRAKQTDIPKNELFNCVKIELEGAGCSEEDIQSVREKFDFKVKIVKDSYPIFRETIKEIMLYDDFRYNSRSLVMEGLETKTQEWIPLHESQKAYIRVQLEEEVQVFKRKGKANEDIFVPYAISDKRLDLYLDTAHYEKQADPFQEYYRKLEWDGTPRINTLLQDFFGADDDGVPGQFTRWANWYIT